MNRSQWIALTAGITLCIACFMPWSYISTPGITISGVDAGGTRYGKLAYNHFILTALVLCCTFITKLWAKRVGLVVGAINLAWAIKNFIAVSRCEAGECPEKQLGLYLLLFSAIVLLATTFFPAIALSEKPADIEEE